MPRKWYESEIIKIESVSPTTRRFWLEIEDEESFDFIPGQFIIMDLPISDKRTKRWRSYSIASAPDGSNVIELCIVNLEGGAGTSYLFEEAEIGTKLKFKGPNGTFTTPKNLDQESVFVCTGTGVAPFRSMMQYIDNNEIAFNKIHLIFGTRYASGILYRDEFDKWAAKYPHFTYSIALSREENWGGHKGYVHDIYMADCQENKENKKYYLCGWTGMIDDAVANLITKCNLDPKQIVYELYG